MIEMFESRILAAKIQYRIWMYTRTLRKAENLHKDAMRKIEEVDRLLKKVKTSQVETDEMIEKLKGMSLYDL